MTYQYSAFLPKHEDKTPGVFASTTSNPQQWLVDWFRGGQETDAGVAVTYSSSLSYAYVFGAVSMISSDVASLPLNVYDVEDGGDREVNANHPAQWLLNEEISIAGDSHMDSLTFRELLTSHVLLWGNGYAAIRRDGSMRPTELIPMLPDRTEPLLDERGRLFYRNYPTSQRGKMVSSEIVDMMPRDVLHIRGLGWDGLAGHSVITLARNSWGLGMAQQQHGASHFKDGGEPSVTLETEQRVDQPTADTLLARWEARHRNRRRPALLTNGLKVSPFSMSNEDSQWLESRAFQRTEVAVWFRMPPHKLGDSARTAYNSLESENRSYLNQTLKGWLKKWESECRRKLLTERSRRSRSRVIQHDTQDLITADIETQVDVLTKLREAEIVNRNEVRRKLGWSSTEGGDDFTNPNVRPAERSPNEDTGETSLDARAIAGQRALVADRVQRVVGIEVKRVMQAASRESNFVSWVNDFYQDEVPALLATSLEPVVAAYSCLPGVVCTTTATEAAQGHASESKSILLNVAGYSDTETLEANVTAAVSDWPNRAEIVAARIVEG